MEAGISYTGYAPGAIGEITRSHAVYYNRHWGFDRSFEIQVAGGLASFMERFSPSRDGLWTAWSSPEFVGSVAVDGDTGEPERARLRWFIVAPDFQGRGIGSTLIEKALAFAGECGFKGVFLWTFEGLEQARSIYQAKGFQLAHEQEVDQWGRRLREQRFDLVL